MSAPEAIARRRRGRDTPDAGGDARPAAAPWYGRGGSAVAPLLRGFDARLRRSPAAAKALDGVRDGWDRLVEAFCQAAEPLLLRVFPDLRLVAVLGGDGALALHRVGRDGATTALGPLDAMAPEALAGLAATRWSAVELRLPATLVLERRLSLPAASREYLAPIIGHRLDRLTPWHPERVLYGFRTLAEGAGDGTVAVLLTATSRDLVAAPLERIRGAGLAPTAIGADAAEPGRVLAVNLLGGGATPRAESRRFVSRAALATLAVLLLAAVVTALMAASAAGDRDAAAARLGKASRLLRAASSYRDLGRREQGMLAEKQADRSALVLIDTLAASIPDDTYLKELTIQSDKLRLTGSSGNAPALVGRLEAAGLRNVRFTSTIARDRSGRDDFELSADRPPARAGEAP